MLAEGKRERRKSGMADTWNNTGIVQCKSDGDVTRRCVDGGTRKRRVVLIFLFFFFWLRNDDRLKYWITEDGVRGWTRDGSLEEVYSCSSLFHDLKGNEFKIRGFETVRTVSFHRYRYKGWKISFRLRSIHAPFCTHTHRERSNKDTSNGARRDQSPKGMIAKLFFFFQSKKT